MSEQQTIEQAPSAAPLPPPMPETDTTPAPDMDKLLSDVYDRGYVTNGADRADDGKFVSPEPVSPAAESVSSSAVEAGGEGAESSEQASSLAATEVPLPVSWTDKSADWAKLPPELRTWVAEHENRTQKTMTEQGRTIAAMKPVQDVLKQYEQAYAGRAKAHEAVQFLFDAHSKLENPGTRIQALLGLADSYGARGELAKSLGIQNSQPADTQALLQKIDSLQRIISETNNPDRLMQSVDQRLNQRTAEQEAQKTFDDFSKSNPLIKEVPETVLLDFIELAKKQLPDTSTPSDVLGRAYDMAIYSDPALRAKVAAPKPAPATDAKKAEEAKRAASVNVTSTSTGKERVKTLDEALSDTYDRLNRKG